MSGASSMPLAVSLTIAFGAGVTALATLQAIRGRMAGFWWALLAGLGQAFLALAAALRDPEGAGGRAAALQILVAAAAGLLGVVCSRSGEGEEEQRDAFSRLGRAVAWAALVGFPVTAGFPSKVVLVRALLDLDWTWLAVLALAAGTAAMWPALAAFRSPGTGRLGWAGRAAAAAMMLIIIAPGLYPQWAVSAADWVARVVFS